MDQTPKLLCRFFSHVKVSRGCWDWIGAKNDKGYGKSYYNGNTISAHRLSYIIFIGDIPDGLHIDHLCENTSCVRPDHLEPVTPEENTLRSKNWAATHLDKTHCPQGHPYSESNTNIVDGMRYCKTCSRLRISEKRRLQKIANSK